MYNKLLQRLIRRNLGGQDVPTSLQPLLQAISESFDHYESSRELLERSLDVSSQELNEANKKIKDAYSLIEDRNKDIMDSIKYAKKIQDAILPTEFMIQESIEESFILFKPKDIVSGDFYWMHKADDGKLTLAAVDCTGHGVPGAIMSMIGNAMLNEIVKEKQVDDPAMILNMLRTSVVGALRQKGEIGEAQDGMDIALITLDLEQMKLSFAGANNPLYVMRNGMLEVVKGDKQPIGFHMGRMKDFTRYETDVNPGDTFYIFTDGYQDQFGGPNQKKFMARQFKELLMDIQTLSMYQQKETLDDKFHAWKRDLDQVDDICVMGIRI